MRESRRLPAVLTIAGSDSGGGAGIQADLRTFNSFRVYGCSVITAITAQNPDEIRRVDVLSAGSVKSQLETLLHAIPVRVAKTGMLAGKEIVECVAEIAPEYGLELVIDPVMISTSGVKLLEESAIRSMKEKLFPLAKWLTPNIPEAEFICNRKINSAADLASAAKQLYEQYGCNVILKSGHLPDTASDKAADIVCYEGKLSELTSKRIPVSGNTSHGTGCTLSAALAANLALGKHWDKAVMESKAFVCGSLAERVFLSDTLCQMYPPEKSYLDAVVLQSCEK